MTTDNTQELDEILGFIENYGVSASCDGFDPHKSRSQAKQAILDWHNKQTLELLDRLAAQRGILSDPVHGEKSIPLSAIEAERNKLKEKRNDT